MGEVVHLSFGPQANYLNASFYNLQESYFVYTADQAARSPVDPRIRFVYGKEFTPRAVFWDFRNGLGSWRRFSEKYEDPEPQDRIVSSQDRVVRANLRPEDPQPSWTDHIRVPLHPSSLHEIPGWEFDPVKFPFGRQRGAPEGQDQDFSLVAEGVDQFAEVSKQDGLASDEYLDTTFRVTVEKCDRLGGVNIVTDLGGWAGFAGKYLEALRDDFIPRTPVFTWASSRLFEAPRMSIPLRRSRLEALQKFAEFSSILIPLQDTHATDFQKNAEAYLRRFETLCLMSSLRQNPVSMFDIAQELTFGLPHANIVQSGPTIYELSGAPKNVRNVVKLERGATRHIPSEGASSELGGNATVYRSHWCSQPYQKESFSEEAFELNDNPLRLRKIVPPGDHELKELVYDLTDDYIWGWSDDSDEDYE